MVPHVFGLGQKVVRDWLGNSKAGTFTFSNCSCRRCSKAFLCGFSVRKMGSSLNASLNCGVLIAQPGISTWSLQPLSMMCCAGQESLWLEFHHKCLWFWRKVHIFLWTLMLLKMVLSHRSSNNRWQAFCAPLAYGRGLQENKSGSINTKNTDLKKKKSYPLVWNRMEFFISCIILHGFWIKRHRREERTWKTGLSCPTQFILLIPFNVSRRSLFSVHWRETFPQISV